VSRYQEGKTNLDFYWSKRQSVAMARGGPYANVRIAPEINHASTPPLSLFTGWMPFLPPNQQRQSTEGDVASLTSQILKPSFHATNVRIIFYSFAVNDILFA